MALAVQDLTEEEQLDYWNRLEVYARKRREQMIHRTRLGKHLQEAGVDRATSEEVLDKENARLEAAHGPEPNPESVRALRSSGVV